MGIGSSLGTGRPSGWWFDIVLIVEFMHQIVWVDAIQYRCRLEESRARRFAEVCSVVHASVRIKVLSILRIFIIIVA